MKREIIISRKYSFPFHHAAVSYKLTLSCSDLRTVSGVGGQFGAVICRAVSNPMFDNS